MLRPKKQSALKIYGALFVLIALGICITALALKDKKTAPTSITVFNEPRLVKPFQLTADNKTFTEKNLLGYWTFLLFGYTHCSDVCPENLNLLNNAYQKLNVHYNNLQILFVSLDKADQAEDVSHYAHSFNKNFIGATAPQKELSQIQQQFGIYAQSDVNNNIQHSSSILLINPQGQWIALFPYGAPVSQITDAFKKIVGI